MVSSIALEEVTVTFGSFRAITDASLDVQAGEFVCLLGPSGCGKSTLLNTIAGFVAPSAGRVLVDGQAVTRPDASRGVVFQHSDALFPWLTVRQNVAFGPRMRGASRSERERITTRYLDLVGLTSHAQRYPAELSGGMQQRVQLARVLANEPSVVLMDEPFGALDAQTRETMQSELEAIWRSTQSTILFVTHDIGEALRLADRIVTMTAGPEATIKKVYPVEVPHPRDITGDDAIALYRELRNDIGAEVTKTLELQS